MSVATLQLSTEARHHRPAPHRADAPSVVRWLGEPGGDELALVGGKAANLSRLAASQPVPPGFTLTTRAFENARDAASGGEPLRADEPLRRVIGAAYAELCRRAGDVVASVAVRSSAADEDGRRPHSPGSTRPT